MTSSTSLTFHPGTHQGNTQPPSPILNISHFINFMLLLCFIFRPLLPNYTFKLFFLSSSLFNISQVFYNIYSTCQRRWQIISWSLVMVKSWSEMSRIVALENFSWGARHRPYTILKTAVQPTQILKTMTKHMWDHPLAAVKSPRQIISALVPAAEVLVQRAPHSSSYPEYSASPRSQVRRSPDVWDVQETRRVRFGGPLRSRSRSPVRPVGIVRGVRRKNVDERCCCRSCRDAFLRAELEQAIQNGRDFVHPHYHCCRWCCTQQHRHWKWYAFGPKQTERRYRCWPPFPVDIGLCVFAVFLLKLAFFLLTLGLVCLQFSSGQNDRRTFLSKTKKCGGKK